MKQKCCRKYKQSAEFRWVSQEVNEALQVLRWSQEMQFCHAKNKLVMFKILDMAALWESIRRKEIVVYWVDSKNQLMQMYWPSREPTIRSWWTCYNVVIFKCASNLGTTCTVNSLNILYFVLLRPLVLKTEEGRLLDIINVTLRSGIWWSCGIVIWLSFCNFWLSLKCGFLHANFLFNFLVFASVNFFKI